MQNYKNRPEYGELLDLSSHFPKTPLMALTATATPPVKEKLISMLRNPIQEVSTVNQPNISYHALEAKKLPKKGNAIVVMRSNGVMCII